MRQRSAEIRANETEEDPKVLLEQMRLLSAEIRVNATKENHEQQLVATVLNHCRKGSVLKCA